MHVADLDGVSNQGGKQWKATVSITIHNADQIPVMGAIVSGTWSDGYEGVMTCTTDDAGLCSLTTPKIYNEVNVVRFTVDDVTYSGLTYEPADNADPDGDSDGTTITVNKP